MTFSGPLGGAGGGLAALERTERIYMAQTAGRECCCKANRFEIKASPEDEDLLVALEEPTTLLNLCAGKSRGFVSAVTDPRWGSVAFHVERPWMPCCTTSCQVTEGPPGQGGAALGSVDYNCCAACSEILEVKDKLGITMLRIEGPCAGCRCCADVVFKLISPTTDSEVGSITRVFQGACGEACTYKSRYWLDFPKDADVALKATLVGAVLLLDILFHEDDGNNN